MSTRLATWQVREAKEDAQRGGARGVEFDVAALIRLESRGLLPSAAPPVPVRLSDGQSAPLWEAVYWCVRCADAPAALRGSSYAMHAALRARRMYARCDSRIRDSL